MYRLPLRSLSLSLIAVCALGFAAHAQEKAATPPAAASGTQLAVVNIQEIMHDSLAAKSIKEQLEKKQKAFQAELSAKEDKLQKEGKELQKLQATLSKEAMEQKVKEFDTKAKTAQKEVQTKRAQLDKAFSNSIVEIQKEVNKILADMAKEKGFIVVLPAQQILYHEARLDITQEVLTRLNKSLPKVTLNF